MWKIFFKKNCPDDYIFFVMKDILTIKNKKKTKRGTRNIHKTIT